MRKTNRLVKISVFTLGLGIFGLLPMAQAMADHRNRHNYGYEYGYNDYRYDRYDRHNWWHYRHHRRNHHDGGNGDAIALGVITGGLLFYALTANQRRHDYDRPVYRNRPVYVQQQPVYVQPVRQQWTRPAPPQNHCLQVREYQTTVTVGNQNVPAYGQSCLQPDGSWKLGPATPVPGY